MSHAKLLQLLLASKQITHILASKGSQVCVCLCLCICVCLCVRAYVCLWVCMVWLLRISLLHADWTGAGCRALSRVLDPEAAAVTFQNLAKKLIALLQKPSATTSPALPAALKALGTLGQVAPAVFAEHATSMADFVLDDLLETPVSSLSPSKAKHLKAPVEGRAGASPHQGIVLKMLGLKVRKCIPPQCLLQVLVHHTQRVSVLA